MEYEDLDKHYMKPKNWTPVKMSFFDQYSRIPRKLKKEAKRKASTSLPLMHILWDALYQKNPNYCRFLIKQIIKYEKS